MIHFFVISDVKTSESGLFSDWLGKSSYEKLCSFWLKIEMAESTVSRKDFSWSLAQAVKDFSVQSLMAEQVKCMQPLP